MKLISIETALHRISLPWWLSGKNNEGLASTVHLSRGCRKQRSAFCQWMHLADVGYPEEVTTDKSATPRAVFFFSTNNTWKVLINYFYLWFSVVCCKPVFEIQ